MHTLCDVTTAHYYISGDQQEDKSAHVSVNIHGESLNHYCSVPLNESNYPMQELWQAGHYGTIYHSTHLLPAGIRTCFLSKSSMSLAHQVATALPISYSHVLRHRPHGSDSPTVCKYNVEWRIT